MIKVKKMIVHLDLLDKHQERIFSFEQEFNHEYLAGNFGPILKEDFKHKVDEVNIISAPLFNRSGNMRQAVPVGNLGLYYLRLRPGHWLDKIFIEPEPDNVVADIYFSDRNSLLYSFYNRSKNNDIVITAHLAQDEEGIYSKLKSEPSDIVFRKYFIRRALISSDELKSSPVQEVIQDLPPNKVMSADEAANYLGMNKKTLQNYASEGKVNKLRGGKFRKKDLDLFLESKSKKGKSGA